MAFSQARQFGGGISRAPSPMVEPSRGAAGAPGGASLSGLPQGGSAANDIAGALGLGGGMLGKFLYDKYKDNPEALKQLLGIGTDIGGTLLPSDNPALVDASQQQIASGMPPQGPMGGQLGVPQGAVDAAAQVTAAGMGGDISNLASNFGAGYMQAAPQASADLAAIMQQYGIPQYIGV